MAADEKKKFQDQADEDKARYQRELASFKKAHGGSSPQKRSRKEKKVRKPRPAKKDGPKRAM